MCDRNQPAKPGDPAPVLYDGLPSPSAPDADRRARKPIVQNADGDAAHRRLCSRVVAGLLCALAMAGRALAKAGMPPLAPKRKTYRFRGSRVEILSNCSWIYGAPNGRAELFANSSTPNSQSRGAAVTSHTPPQSRDAWLCRRPIPPSVDPMNRVTTSLCTRARLSNLEAQ